jgi:hypothetical protein
MWNNTGRVRRRVGPTIFWGAFVPVTANLVKLVDKEYQDKSLAELVDAPVAALAGVSERTATHLKEALGIKTIGELGRSQYFRTARALVDLADHGE